MASYTDDELLQIVEDSLEAATRGDKAEEMRLIKMLPVDPGLAMAAKKIFGKDFLVNGGWDISEANEKYGEGWINE